IAAMRARTVGCYREIPSGEDQFDAEPDEIGSACPAQDVEPHAHELDRRGQPEHGNREPHKQSGLGAGHVQQAGARALAQAVGDDHRDGRTRHNDDQDASEAIGNIGVEGHGGSSLGGPSHRLSPPSKGLFAPSSPSSLIRSTETTRLPSEVLKIVTPCTLRPILRISCTGQRISCLPSVTSIIWSLSSAGNEATNGPLRSLTTIAVMPL